MPSTFLNRSQAMASKRYIRTIATRLALEAVKTAIRRQGGRPSQFDSKDIRKAAISLVDFDPYYLTEAEADLKKPYHYPQATAEIQTLLSKVSDNTEQAQNVR